MPKRPNILFLMSDEHRPDVAGWAGNQVIRTPVLDMLAKDGVVFSNAYTPSPICIPARQCILSGQLPRTNHCEQFGQDLPPGSLTFARQLALEGYETVVSGKLHHLGTDQMQGWTSRISGDIQINPQYVGGKAMSMRKPFLESKWSDAKEIARAGIGKGLCITHDAYAVQGAKQFIEDYFCNPYYDREQTHPLLLKLSLLQPHYPYLTSEEKFNYYLNRVTPYVHDEVFDHPFLSQHQVRTGTDATERDLRRATAAYYGMVETIDEMYGDVLNALTHVGQDLDDWIIVYTSDHGEMLGQHGIWEKQKFFEASVRVPLIIRYPRKFGKGRVVEQNVNLCDLFATLCDLSDTPVPQGLDSRSLVPLMADSAAEWNNETISQFMGTNLMIKQDHLKYQYYGETMPEVLFDLARNPEESFNFIHEPDYAPLLARFRKRRAELGFGPDASPDYQNAGYA
ncbi:sulfatase-like hydrolase/transferase [Paenibacillus aceris]|uniref:Choline-sulfatase n=1 Tax=Paenibacillus aceris TaxID=869555 RepID=A0ABS4I3N9_9BACL|nr:sulfatase-like hydrolase/transferase [Paenibacillus aceris]MBP1965539.1 choline-sulfatase [Paenibacillus aceris]NHW33412.1 sulfatase-like hydrolase/transferase [Paenibacillus aceris]